MVFSSYICVILSHNQRNSPQNRVINLIECFTQERKVCICDDMKQDLGGCKGTLHIKIKSSKLGSWPNDTSLCLGIDGIWPGCANMVD